MKHIVESKTINKKGFTLVEIIAVVAILAIITVVATVSIGNIKGDIDLKVIEGNINDILEAAKMYGDEDLNRLSSNPIEKTVSNLKSTMDLEIDESYDNIRVIVYLKNRRAAACIKSSEDIKKIVKSENLDKFSKYYCSDEIASSAVFVEENYATFATGQVVNSQLNLLQTERGPIERISICDSITATCSAYFSNSRIVSSSDSIAEIQAIVNSGTLYIYSEKPMQLNEDASGMFANLTALKDVSALKDISMVSTKNMDRFLSGDWTLTVYGEINSWNVSNVKSMKYFFYNNMSMSNLDLSNWNTSNVESMISMFMNVYGVSNLNIAHFDTSRVTDASGIFYNLQTEKLDLGKWDLSKLENCNSILSNSNVNRFRSPKKMPTGCSITLNNNYKYEVSNGEDSGSGSGATIYNITTTLNSSSPTSTWFYKQ